jgi:hypothetical protein
MNGLKLVPRNEVHTIQSTSLQTVAYLVECMIPLSWPDGQRLLVHPAPIRSVETARPICPKKLRGLNKEARMLKDSIDDAEARIVEQKDRDPNREE